MISPGRRGTAGQRTGRRALPPNSRMPVSERAVTRRCPADDTLGWTGYGQVVVTEEGVSATGVTLREGRDDRCARRITRRTSLPSPVRQRDHACRCSWWRTIEPTRYWWKS